MAKQKGIPAEISAMSFEAALSELETIVARLESGNVALEESIAIYEKGALLKRHCAAKLQAAQEKIDKIVIDDQGSAMGTTPANVE